MASWPQEGDFEGHSYQLQKPFVLGILPVSPPLGTGCWLTLFFGEKETCIWMNWRAPRPSKSTSVNLGKSLLSTKHYLGLLLIGSVDCLPLSTVCEWKVLFGHFCQLEKAVAPHSSILAWRIPGMGEPGGLPSMGSHRVGHDWSDLAAAAASWFCYAPGCWGPFVEMFVPDSVTGYSLSRFATVLSSVAWMHIPFMQLVSLLSFVKWAIQVQFIRKKNSIRLQLKQNKDEFLNNVW